MWKLERSYCPRYKSSKSTLGNWFLDKYESSLSTATSAMITAEKQRWKDLAFTPQMLNDLWGEIMSDKRAYECILKSPYDW